MKALPNRIALYLTAAAALLAALAPIVADLDWESTAGVIAGITALTGVVSVWLRGWSQWERGEGAFPTAPAERFGEDEPPLASHAPAEGAPIVNPDAPQQPRR